MSKRHEQLLFRYSSALERGDFQVVADVLHEAERDPALEQMILDMNDAYSAERFNHTNPKEIPMIAALYQNPKPARPRANWQSLPLAAALAVIALLTVLLAVQTRGSSLLNTGGSDSPAAAQINPYCTGTLVSTFTTVPLRSRPAPDAPVVTELQYANNAGRDIVVLDVASVEGETWVFVRVPSSPDVPFGWTTEAQLRTMVADCQPLVAPVEAVVTATTERFNIEATAIAVPLLPTSEPFSIEATLSIMPLTPTAVPLDDALQLVATANAQAARETSLPPTVVPPSAEQGVSIAATDLARFGEGGFCKATTLTTAGVRAFPEWDSVVITTLPGDTLVSVGSFATSTDAQGNPLRWYVVGFEDARGWMPASQLDMSACPVIASTSPNSPVTQVAATSLYMTATPTMQMATALPPTVMPFSIEATAVPPEGAVAESFYVPYDVQPGDTLLSIFTRFNLHLDLLSEVLRINGLSSADALTVGMELQLPVFYIANCRIADNQSLDVRSQPSDDAAVIATLPGGTVFQGSEQTNQRDRLWLPITAQLPGITISEGWVRADRMGMVADCKVKLPPTEVVSEVIPIMPTVVFATPTPLPFGDEPTALPPLVVTATPIPVTLVPIMTATMPPTPTPVQ